MSSSVTRKPERSWANKPGTRPIIELDSHGRPHCLYHADFLENWKDELSNEALHQANILMNLRWSSKPKEATPS